MQVVSGDDGWRTKYQDLVTRAQRDLQLSERSLFQLQGALQRHSLANALLLFGSAPHAVELTIALPDKSEETVRLEFRYLDEMPHTVYTFLMLIEIGLYTGTTLRVSNDQTMLIGGNPRDSVSRIRSHLNRRYAEHGFGATPLLMEETAPQAVCTQHSVGMVEKGPDFGIHLTNQYRNMDSCPGRIVSGLEVVWRLQGMASHERATIIDVRILKRKAVRDEL